MAGSAPPNRHRTTADDGPAAKAEAQTPALHTNESGHHGGGLVVCRCGLATADNFHLRRPEPSPPRTVAENNGRREPPLLRTVFTQNGMATKRAVLTSTLQPRDRLNACSDHTVRRAPCGLTGSIGHGCTWGLLGGSLPLCPEPEQSLFACFSSTGSSPVLLCVPSAFAGHGANLVDSIQLSC